MNPPPLPEETLRRVLRTAKLDGLSLVIIASMGAFVSLAMGDLMGMTVGALVAVGGAVELSGRKRLLRGDIAGMRRLVRAQMIVLAVILVYCARQLLGFDIETTMNELTPYTGVLTEAGVDLTELLPLIRKNLPIGMYTLYGLVALLTLFYQGGMARYYKKRTAVVQQALADRARPVVLPRLAPRVDPEDLVT